MERNLHEEFHDSMQEIISKSRLSIYGTEHNKTHKIINPPEVIRNFVATMKNIQRAEGTKLKRKSEPFMKKSQLCSLSALSKSIQVKEPEPTPNSFETHCVSDTQLMNIVQNAEAALQNVANGITQEFDTSFDIVNSKLVNETKTRTDRQLVGRDPNVQSVTSNVINDPGANSKSLAHEVISQNSNITQILDESIEVESSIVGSLIQEIEDRSKRSELLRSLQCSPHLVFDLKAFEDFENSVAPFLCEPIEDNFQSQMIESVEAENKVKSSNRMTQENCIPCTSYQEFEPDILQSQILKPTKMISSKSVNMKTAEQRVEVECKPELPAQTYICEKDYLSDEILFSSDEESDYIHTSVRDMPLTCALETSFFTNDSQILDKTVFVGFQTASNRTIQVTTDSLNSAKKLFDDIAEDKEVTGSFADIVEKYDKTRGNSETESTEILKKDTIFESCMKTKVEYLNKIETVEPDKWIHQPTFRTASNKCITVSEDAVIQTKKVFQDIDLIDSVIKNKPNKNEILSENKNTSDILGVCMHGFTTASNKKIEISKKAMNLCKTVFQDIDLCETFASKFTEDIETEIEPTNITKLTQFEAANKKDVNISDDLLAQSRKLFNGDTDIGIPLQKSDTNEKHIKQTNVLSDFTENVRAPSWGFKTASNKPVTISDEAMQKSKVMLQEYMPLDTDNPPQIGFKMANNRKVDISKESLSHKQTTFEVNPENTFTNNDTDTMASELLKSAQIPVFKTASNKDIPILEASIIKSRQLLNEIDIDLTATNTLHNQEFKGFHTASEKPIGVSNEALEQSKQIFSDLDINKEPKDHKERNSRFVGFQTASNKIILVSDEALMKSKVLLDSIEKEDISVKINVKDPKLEGYNAFHTASETPISISTEALEKSKQIFVDMEINKDPSNHTEQSTRFVGFQTASNKIMNVSNEALMKSKALLDSIEKEDVSVKINVKEPKLEGFKAFHTASEIPIGVSNEALEKSKQIFRDIKINEEPSTHTEQSTQFVGFQTASNKIIHVSDEALIKSKALLDSIEKEDVSVNVKEPKLEVFKAFHTASEKPIGLSTEALEKSKQIFRDIKINKESSNHTEQSTQFVGFQTASNKTIHVSEEALIKSKALLDNIEKEDVSLKIDVKEPKFTGFRTANNKNITVSEDAFEKSKAMFNDMKDVNDMNSITQTSANKNVSMEILEKSRGLSGVNINKEDYTVPQPKDMGFTSFQTSNNKQTLVFKEELVNSKALLGKNYSAEANLMRFQTGNSKKVAVLENSLTKSKALFHDLDHGRYNSVKAEGIDLKSYPISNAGNIGDTNELLNTQVLNNFDEELNTEDFRSPKTFKRPSSPILSCPKAKRKCFKTPYKQEQTFITPKKHTILTNIKDDKKVIKVKMNFDTDYKKNKTLSLDQLQEIEKRHCGEIIHIDEKLTNLAFDNLLEFEFNEQRNTLTHTKIDTRRVQDMFLQSVDEKIVPDGWLDIQLKLILWKLLSYEIRFPYAMVNVCNVKTVLDQLNYRYTRELYNVQRPALRKILEKDDVPSKVMILCVVQIYEDGVLVTDVANPMANIELLLTDGWYCIKACADRWLSKLTFDRKLTVGSKIATQGAELLNCEQGVAAWEDTSKIRLKLFGNSTRRARWDAKLGFHGNAAILTHLSTVKVDGGKVSKTRLFVSRVYPMLYVEKFEDGSTVTRSERLEQINQMKYETDRQNALEKLYEDIEREISDQESEDSQSEPRRPGSESGSQLARMMRRSTDPAEFRATLTPSQARLLCDHVTRERERKSRDIEARLRAKMAASGLPSSRDVIGLLKLRVSGIREAGGQMKDCKGTLTIWRPNDAILELVSENTWLDVTHVAPTAVKFSEIQLSAGRQSMFQKTRVRQTDKITAYTSVLRRRCLLIKDLVQHVNVPTEYNEIDTFGIVVSTDPTKEEFENGSAKNQFQNVYLADLEKNMISVNFWGGVKKYGYENTLDRGQLVYCANLQKRIGNTRKSIPQFRATELTVFTKTPKHVDGRTMLDSLAKRYSGIDRRKFCAECRDCQILRAKSVLMNGETISPYRFNRSDYNLSKHQSFIDTPVNCKREVDLNLSGLDFETTFKQTDTQDMSPELMKRRKWNRDKMAMLKLYGEPPPLHSISIKNKSIHASSSYKSPLVNVASFKENLPNNSPVSTTNFSKRSSVSSPIVNRSYGKRPKINPVKLDFTHSVASKEHSAEDLFAGEFESSPPLSLD